MCELVNQRLDPMSIRSRDIQKIEIWFLLPAFVIVSLILADAGLLAVFYETFTLIVILEIVSALFLIAQQRSCSVYCFGIHPRSPPIF